MFRSPVGPAEKLLMRLVAAQRAPVFGPLIWQLLKARGVMIPSRTFNAPPYLPHVGPIVVHPNARLGRGVTLFHGVTIGRGNIWEEPHPDFEGFAIEDDVILCAGAVVIGSHGTLTIGRGAVIGANAVVTTDVPPGELWAGNPARKVGVR